LQLHLPAVKFALAFEHEHLEPALGGTGPITSANDALARLQGERIDSLPARKAV